VPGLTRAQQQERTRERILDAAAALFAERGYNATTVEDIAELAGHTRSAVYKSIGDKENVLLAVATRRGSFQQDDWQRRIQSARTDERRLVALAELFLTDLSPSGRWGLARSEFLTSVADKPQRLQRVLDTQAAADDRGAAILEELCAALGVEPPMPARQLFIVIVALANGLSARAVLDPTFDLRATLTNAVNLLLRPDTAMDTAPTTIGRSNRR
jgi:AcrR family transcriptional regulator